MELQPLPVSQARNARQLMEEVLAHIKAKPACVYMSDFVAVYRDTAITGRLDGFTNGMMELPVPECGTLGCIAGWMGLMVGMPRYQVNTSAIYRLLGIFDNEKYYELRSELHSLFHDDFPSASYGTKEYADHVINRIEGFLVVWGNQLEQLPLHREVVIHAD